MRISQVEIEGVPPLEAAISFDCDERVNLFIGPNASGKTTILRAMNGLNSPLADGSSATQEYSLMAVVSPNTLDERSRMFCWLRVRDDWPRDAKEWLIPTALPILYIPAIRMNLRGRDIFNFSQIMDSPEEQPDAPLEYLFDTDSGVFYGQYVELAIDQLIEKMAPSPPPPEERTVGWTLGGMIDRERQTQLRKAIEVGYLCAKGICPEVVHDAAPHLYVEDDYDEKVEHYGMGIGTGDNILGEPLYAGALSSGTQSTLLWIWALALKMAHHYDWQESWEKKPAILLIDEIENHLHPTWQRRVIPALLKHFPGLQIFATTHSPFVIAGRKAGQVHLLKRDENGVVTASTNTEDIIGWTADGILRTMMGVDDPTDDATAAAARELRQLRQESPRATPEKEEQRQERIRELRKKVDRDLLAGGPMARQREIFEERFSRVLERYRESQDLNQEGS